MTRDSAWTAASLSAAPATESLIRLLTPLIREEVSGISAISVVIAAEKNPGYIRLFRDATASKQANVEQMVTLIRMSGGVPEEKTRVRQFLEKAEVRLAETVGGPQGAIREIRSGSLTLLGAYSRALPAATGLVRSALEKALGRTTIHVHLLTAHLARLSGDDGKAPPLPRPFGEYFVDRGARVCMRCHLDRPGTRPRLERRDPHPYTYICAGCHDDAIEEFRPDMRAQMDRWTEQAREARVIQQALGRPSRLLASHTVHRRLSGLPEDPPRPNPQKPLGSPLPGPCPEPFPPSGVVQVDPLDSAEAEYVATLFDPDKVSRSW